MKKFSQKLSGRLQVTGMFSVATLYLSIALFLAGSPAPVIASDTSSEPPNPIPTTEAAQRMTVPAGFQASLFAGEPDVVQPIAMTTDERGRLWVVECLSYPNWQTNGAAGRDRVVIFEDRDNDGHFDSRRVFWDKGRNLTSIALGFGGVWLCSTPELIFLPDRNHDDRPDGPPEAVLDGWSLEAKHNIVNGLSWGPDGWLYGCHGILADSKIGRPGAPDAERVTLNCGVWRYHPTRKMVEVVAHGTTNPWGVAFDDFGQMFVANCVIKHLFHVIPGAHYERMYGQDINPYSFQLIPSCADHIHWAGGWWKTEGAEHPHNDAAGGGHAHCGALVYLGDNWPDRYRNTFFTLNIHGHRVNNDRLERTGSGYVGKHQPDLLKANDAWFRGVALQAAADGGVFMSDWSDADECHDYEDIHRENGRIYKITYERPRLAPTNLAALSDAELVRLQLQKNDWLVSQARRLLQERAAAGKLEATTRPALVGLLHDQTDATRQLRALWALHVTGGLDESLVSQLLVGAPRRTETSALGSTGYRPVPSGNLPDGTGATSKNNSGAGLPATPTVIPAGRLPTEAGKLPAPLISETGASEWVRAWTIQLALETKSASPTLRRKLADLAAKDPSPVVRLYLASGLQRLALAERLPIAAALAARGEDENDPNLPLLIWYGIEPIVSNGERGAATLLARAKLSLVRQFIARRLALRSEFRVPLIEVRRSADSWVYRDIVQGMFEALNGRRLVGVPNYWTSVRKKLTEHSQAEIAEKALQLSLIFGEAEAVSELSQRVMNKEALPEARQAALQALGQARISGVAPLLQSAVADPTIRGVAIRDLAAFDEPATPQAILQQYAQLKPEEKADAINTLASRGGYAVALLEAVKRGVVPARDISQFAARQIQELKDSRLAPLLTAALGEIRTVSKDKAAVMARLRRQLRPEALKTADASRGRAVFNRTCAACHTLFGEGGKLAPELTGSQRSNLDYLLENVVDPNAVVWKQWRATYFETADDRLISGVVLQENESTVTIQTQTDTITLPRNDIRSRTESTLSMMPEGLFESLPSQELLDLVAYLQSPTQVRLGGEASR